MTFLPNIDFSALSPKRQETLTNIGTLIIGACIIFVVCMLYAWCKKKKYNNIITLFCAFILVTLSFGLPIALNLSFQKDGTGSVLLQSMLTASGGLVVLLTFMESRRKNDIDELKNTDEKIQRIQSSRYEKA